jgi:diguanylate cyclase (GGDEF)-like protein/PAS domain S-box-containing protein
MATTGPQDEGTVEAVLAGLLDRHPEAALCAIGPDGITVSMPDSVRTAGHNIVAGRSPIDLVVPEDRVAVVSAWDRARTTGATHTRVPIRVVGEPDRTVALHILDARPRHGVFIGVVVPTEEEVAEGRVALLIQEVSPVAPRFAQVRQNEVGVFLEVDEAISRILGWAHDELVGRLSLELIHPDDHALAIDNWMEMLASRGPVSRVRLRHCHRDGSWVWMEITNHNRLEDPESRCVVAEMMNISDEMAAHEALRAREQLLERLAEALPVGVFQIDADSRVVYTNNRLNSILDVAGPTSIDELLDAVLPDDCPGLADAFDAVLNSRLDSDLEVRLQSAPEDVGKQVQRCIFSLRALTAETGDVTGAIVCVADVTESARLRDELHIRATFDDVTHCHNRASTMAALETLLSETDPPNRPAVIFVDLNRFKEVNDEFGHAAGDELLGVVARRLLRTVRAEDIVGRIGGDEFLVIRRGTSSAEQAMATSKRLAETFRHQVRIKAGRLSCQASIGVAWSSDPALDAEGLVAMADAAMYEAKRSGCDDPVLYQRLTEVPRHAS